MKLKATKIAVIGDGGWGTTLAIHLAKKDYAVVLWGPFPKYIYKLNKTRYNSKFLPTIRIPEKVEFTDDLFAALKNSELIVFAVPSKYAKDIILKIKAAKINLRDKTFLSVTKGIDNKSLLTISQTVRKYLGHIHFAVLSGPTIAMEVARDIPSTAVIASHNIKIAKKLQEIFNSDKFRIYTNNDVIGVELGGSIKNIIAISCGLCDGLGFGTNTKAAILSRGLVEMARLGKFMGAQQQTFSGLSGLGDLVTTCFNTSSRNRSVGEKLAKGLSIKEIVSSTEMVAEGVETVKAVHDLSRKYKVSMPITTEIFNIIYKDKNPTQAVYDLMTRKTKSE